MFVGSLYFLLVPSCSEEKPMLSVDVPATLIFNADGTGETSVIGVTTNQSSWDYSLTPPDGGGWLSVDKVDMTLRLAAAPNLSATEPVPVIIRITAGDAPVAEITAKQLAGDAVLAVEPNISSLTFFDDGMVIMPGSTDPVAEAVFTVTTNVPDGWAVIFDPADGSGWLSISARGDDTFTLSAESNTRGSVHGPVAVRVTAGDAPAIEISARQSSSTKLNLEGLSGGTALIKYTNGESESAELDASGVGFLTVMNDASPRIIYSITTNITREILIGRKEGETINLKFFGGDLTFRDAVSGEIPIGCYAEFVTIDSNGTTRKGAYIQDADIDLLGSELLEGMPDIMRHQTCIGNDDFTPFTGNYNGNGFVMDNLWFATTRDHYAGLFGLINGGELKNITISSGHIEGFETVGGICGYNYGVITGCYNRASISGRYSAGGICGHNYGTIINCHNEAPVVGDGNRIGGVCGYNELIITGCRNRYPVTGSSITGGVCGANRGTITDCHNEASISGVFYVGGVCGSNFGTINGCHNVASVLGNGDQVGGVCGYNYETIIACCNTGAVLGASRVGGVSGENFSSTLSGCYNTGSVSGRSRVGGVCGMTSSGSTISASYSMGPVSGISRVGGVCGESDDGIFTANYWLKYTGTPASGDYPTLGIGIINYVIGNDIDAVPFDTSSWPGIGDAPDGGTWVDAGWGIGNGSDNSYWKSLGSWITGGSPDGINSTFPKLWWEQ